MVWSFTIIPRHRHFRPAYFCGCWLMTHRCLLPTQTLPHRPCRDSVRTHRTMTLQALLGQRWPNQTALWAGLDARRAMRELAYSQLYLTGSRSLAGLSTGFPLWSDLTSRMGSGNVRSCSRLCLPGERPLVSAHPSLPDGSILVAMTTPLAPLCVTRCSNSTLMPIKTASLDNQQAVRPLSPLHRRRLTKTDLMGELGHLLALPIYQLVLPFTT